LIAHNPILSKKMGFRESNRDFGSLLLNETMKFNLQYKVASHIIGFMTEQGRRSSLGISKSVFGFIIVLEWFTTTPFHATGWLLLLMCAWNLVGGNDKTPGASGLKLFSGAFLAGSVLYFSLLALLSHPIAYAFRMFTYPSAHPFSYIALLSLSYSLLGIFWLQYVETKEEKRWHKFMLFGVPLISLVMAGPFGGMLWVLNDWQHGFVPSFGRAMGTLFWGAQTGLVLGPTLFVLSQPLSGLAVLFGAGWLRIQIQEKR
jgi:hypothetical protein